MTTETTETPKERKKYRRKCYKIHINGDTDAELREELIEITDILVAMREAQKKWKEEFGATNRLRATNLEKLADEWINKHKVYYYTIQSAAE